MGKGDLMRHLKTKGHIEAESAAEDRTQMRIANETAQNKASGLWWQFLKFCIGVAEYLWHTDNSPFYLFFNESVPVLVLKLDQNNKAVCYLSGMYMLIMRRCFLFTIFRQFILRFY